MNDARSQFDTIEMLSLIEGSQLADREVDIRNSLVVHDEQSGLSYLVARAREPASRDPTFHPGTYSNIT